MLPNPDEEWSDRDQVGVVARVTKARVHIRTDSGQLVQQGFGNVEVLERARDQHRPAGGNVGMGGLQPHL